MSNENQSDDGGESSPILRYLLWLLSGLVLAVLGSALWDFIFKSVFIWAGEGLVDLTNFGSAALINSMYKEIAKGNYERASVSIFVFSLGLFSSFLMTLLFSLIAVFRLSVAKSPAGSTNSANFKFGRPGVYLLAGVTLLFVGGLIIQAARTVYIVRAANHLVQMQAVVVPYISAEQRLIYASRVAQIQTKEDYSTIVSELGAIMTSRGLKMPAFDIL